MSSDEKKCVMVIDENLPLGLIANTAVVMGITMGKENPETIGECVWDGAGREHLGIIEFPVPILKGNQPLIRAMRQKLYEKKYAELTVVDFSDVAQSCKTYDEFIDKIATADEQSLNYFGLALCGPKKLVNKLTGNMPLLGGA